MGLSEQGLLYDRRPEFHRGSLSCVPVLFLLLNPFAFAMNCPTTNCADGCSHQTALKASSTGSGPSISAEADAPLSKNEQPKQQQQKQQNTFYRRPLPESCIALSSENGQARFASALATRGLKSFFPLIEQFTTQSEPAFCGLSTLVIVLNALAVDPRRPWKGPWRWYEESMLNCCLDLEEVKSKGITIKDFRCLAMCQGLVTEAVFAEEDQDNQAGLERFEESVKKACIATEEDLKGQRDEFLIVSYSRKVLGQTGSGHFSPIAAYDSASNSVLILDTARFKYGAHWVSLPLLFEAMKPVDPDTGRSRGYILLSHHDHHSHDNDAGESIGTTPSLTPSVLFRTHKKQNVVRRQYKEFLSAQVDGNPTLDQVISYWTKDGTQPKMIWQMMEPQLTPLLDDIEAIELVNSVRTLMNRLIEQETKHAHPEVCCDCRVNYSRTLKLLPQEAIFVVYLASLDESKRREVIRSAEAPLGVENVSADVELTAAQRQLLAEAVLVRYAIDMSDDIGTG